jgi:hypothetical protein
MTKQIVKQVLTFLVCANTVSFLLLAYLHLLPTDPKSAIFIDFWGRFTVYSLWFIGSVVYARYLPNLARRVVIFIVCANIPLFLLLAYFDKLSMKPDTIVFTDFWGRLTVYSFWIICYEAYKAYIETENPRTKRSQGSQLD